MSKKKNWSSDLVVAMLVRILLYSSKTLDEVFSEYQEIGRSFEKLFLGLFLG